MNFKKLNEKTLLQKASNPVTGIKFALFIGLEVIVGSQVNIATGGLFSIASTLLDNMIVSKLNKGWKPGIFVNTLAKNF